MKIEHIALWTPDLERSRTFYETYSAANPMQNTSMLAKTSNLTF
jgi:catechol 2,3-dioxygenase-like lactoylglutathione lyase family enzyme